MPAQRKAVWQIISSSHRVWGVVQFRKYILLLRAWSSPAVIRSSWFRGVDEMPGAVRNAAV